MFLPPALIWGSKDTVPSAVTSGHTLIYMFRTKSRLMRAQFQGATFHLCSSSWGLCIISQHSLSTVRWGPKWNPVLSCLVFRIHHFTFPLLSFYNLENSQVAYSQSLRVNWSLFIYKLQSSLLLTSASCTQCLASITVHCYLWWGWLVTGARFQSIFKSFFFHTGTLNECLLNNDWIWLGRNYRFM